MEKIREGSASTPRTTPTSCREVSNSGAIAREGGSEIGAAPLLTPAPCALVSTQPPPVLLMSSRKKKAASRSSGAAASKRQAAEEPKQHSPPRARSSRVDLDEDAQDAAPVRRRQSSRQTLDSSSSSSSSFSSAVSPRSSNDPELDLLHTRIADLTDEKNHSSGIVSMLAEQDWRFLVDRSQRIKARFDGEMDALIADVEALCEFSHSQKLKSKQFTPSRSRTQSTAKGGAAAAAAAAANADDGSPARLPSSSSSANSSLSPPSVGESRRDNALKQKEFIWRDSKLSDMFRTSADIQTIYNVFAAVLILFALKVWINDAFSLSTPGAVKTPASIHLFLWNFGKVSIVVPMWILMFLTHSLILPIMWLWRTRIYGDVVYTLLYTLHQLAFIGCFAFAIVHLDLPVASSLILLCEQVRMLMKCHSFWRETLRIKYSPQELPQGVNPVNAHLANSPANSTLLPTFRAQLNQFVLFFFVPTLIYRNVYPRTRHIRWRFVASCTAEVLGCVFYLYILFTGFCVPEYINTAANPGDLKALSVSLFNSVLPGIAVYLLAFFGLLHCWMNLFAELTRFADRLFYLDWWNTTSFSSYYRKWNMIVHDHLYNYLYVDLRRLGVPQGVCFFLTFLVSALVHEYIIALSLKFFYPVLLVMFLFFGVGFVFLTKHLGTTGRWWNIFFWANLIIGNGMLLIMYSREYYARNSDMVSGPGRTFAYDRSSWVPLSWQPFVHKA